MKNNERTCMPGSSRGVGYCGRSSAPIVPTRATCTDCHAAFRADQRAEKSAAEHRGGTA